MTQHRCQLLKGRTGIMSHLYIFILSSGKAADIFLSYIRFCVWISQTAGSLLMTRHIQISRFLASVLLTYIIPSPNTHMPNISVCCHVKLTVHHNDVIMSAMASQITSLTIVYLTVYWGADQRKLRSSASMAFIRGIHRWSVNFPHKRPVTRKTFPFDDVSINMWHIFAYGCCHCTKLPKKYNDAWKF